MEFYDVVHTRRSVRKFKPEPVPRQVIMRVLDAANWAPSGGNLQQWEFIVGDPFVQKMHLESVSAAFENLLLAACAEGLGTCWAMGPLLQEAAVRELLNIPADKEIVALTPFGYPDLEPPAPARKDPDLTIKVTWVE